MSDHFDTIGIVGVPQDLGASRRGVDMGASAMRVAGVGSHLEEIGYNVVDYGNITCHDASEHNVESIDPQLRYIDHIVDTCHQLKSTVEQINGSGHFPLVLGGDHSISIGTLAGMKGTHGGKTGILWVDAHGDFNITETTPTGNIHGMPFATILNRGDKRLCGIGPSPTAQERNAVLFGARDLDDLEINTLRESDVSIFSMREIDELGIYEASKRAIGKAISGVDYLHVSFDIDAVDPELAPGTGTPVRGGLTFREAHLLMEMVHDTGKLRSFEMVEVNPTLDTKNKTADLAVGLIRSVMGSKIV